MADVTFIIPIGLSHQHLAQRAMDSVQAQSIPCDLAVLLDTERRGPGALRNQMLRLVQTPFVSFLDADDWIEPTFAEETLAEYQRIGGNAYIFTDWIDGRDQVIPAPCLNGPDGNPISVPDRKPYCGGTWHPLTTLIPTAWARQVNGFDEQLPAVEDTDFYLKLCTTFHCGHRLARALFHYSPAGGRAAAFRGGPEYQRVMGEFTNRYGGKMGCCGDKTAIARPIGEKQPGDVLAMALWHGNRSEFGRVTKRNYPRVSYPRTAWVDPEDVKFSPQLWQMVEQPRVDQPVGIQTLAQMAQVGLATVQRTTPAPVVEPPAPPVEAKPDVSRVIRLGRKAAEKLDEPIFIFPEKDYPSYGDIKRLVALAGFDQVTTKQIDVFNRRPYILVSPEPIPNLKGIPARVICWQLEYAGDYVHNYDGFPGEVWASDANWAADHGAKYVLMGSHPDLAEGLKARKPTWDYDVTMLGYMVPRRQAVKDLLADLRWPVDYPGHGGYERGNVLWATHVMLHVHQHADAPFVAPQRIAVAAAYHMPVISEVTPALLDLEGHIIVSRYDELADTVRRFLAEPTDRDQGLHQFLCVDHPFRTCVLEALKS